MRDGGEDDDKGMVSDTEGVRSLGGRETSSPMRGGICVCVAAVVVMVVAALMVVMERGGGGGVDGSGRKSGVGDGGESIVFRSISGGGSIMYR